MSTSWTDWGPALSTSNPTAVQIGDWLRVVCIVEAALLVAVALALFRARRGLPAPSRWACLTLALLALSTLFTEVGKLSHTVSWRLPVNLLGCTLGLWALRGLLRSERNGA